MPEASRSARRRFLRRSSQLERVEHRQQSGWLRTSQNGLFALISIGFPSRLASVLLLGCSGSVDYVIVFRSGNAFFDEPFIIAPPLVILVVARRD